MDDHYRPVNDLRWIVTRLSDVMAERTAGVLITIDELNRNAAADLREIRAGASR